MCWQQQPNVTLFDYAAHLMSSFSGEEANLALYDGAERDRSLIDQAHPVSNRQHTSKSPTGHA